MGLCSTNLTIGLSRNNQFLGCKILFSCECSRGVAPLGGAVLHKITCHSMSLKDKESCRAEKYIHRLKQVTQRSISVFKCQINMQGMACIVISIHILYLLYITLTFSTFSDFRIMINNKLLGYVSNHFTVDVWNTALMSSPQLQFIVAS